MATGSNLQQPPSAYDQRYFAQLVRDLVQSFNSLATPGRTTIGLLTLVPPYPALAYGLPLGTVYADDGILKIVLGDRAYAGSLKLTITLASVVATG